MPTLRKLPCYNQAMWKWAAWMLLVLLLFIAVPVGWFLHSGGWMMFDHRYRQERLLGLSPEEVTRRLGPPSYDPRSQKTGTTNPAWNVAEDGPLYLGYFQGWATTTIEFKDGRVAQVRQTWK